MCVQWASGRCGQCQETEPAYLIDDQSTIHNHIINVLFSYIRMKYIHVFVLKNYKKKAGILH